MDEAAAREAAGERCGKRRLEGVGLVRPMLEVGGGNEGRPEKLAICGLLLGSEAFVAGGEDDWGLSDAGSNVFGVVDRWVSE